MPQTSVVSANLSFIKTATPSGGAANATQGLSMLRNLPTGTADGSADIGWVSLARSLTTGATEDIDVRGALTDAFGIAVASVELVGLAVQSAATNTTNLTIGNGSNPLQMFFGATTHSIILKPKDFFVWYGFAGWATTAGTADIIKVANAAGATALYDIAFLGRSA